MRARLPSRDFSGFLEGKVVVMRRVVVFLFAALMALSATAFGAAAGSASRVTARVVPTNWRAKCPHTFQFSATIVARTPGTVTYHWERSDNSSSAPATTTFARAGDSKTVRTAWTLSNTGQGVMHGWQRLQVEDGGPHPAPAPFVLQCK